MLFVVVGCEYGSGFCCDFEGLWVFVVEGFYFYFYMLFVVIGVF